MKTTPQIQIDLDSATPVNRQIIDHLRTLLVDETLKPGDALPSVRRLAIDLGVHFNTVADAYRALADEGWLEISHGRGARVCTRKPPTVDEETVGVFRRRLRQLVAEMRAQGVSSGRVARELSDLAKGDES